MLAAVFVDAVLERRRLYTESGTFVAFGWQEMKLTAYQHV